MAIEPANNQPEVEVDDLDEANEVIPATYTITSYGADYPVDSLVKRLENEDIVVPLFSLQPGEGQSTVGFQREFVWTKPQSDRFIESLLLGLPVPGIFLVKEPSGKHLVLDGQQRLRTLQGFYAGMFQSKEYLLDNVQQKWRGKTFKTLNADDRRRLDDSIIHATIVRQDEPTDEQSSIYLIFERLNSGGTFLQPQEIRVALYHGPLVALLSELNTNADWRALYGKKSARLKDLELILRFFAFHYHTPNYRQPMKVFLNRYMAQNVDLKKNPAADLKSIFGGTVQAIHHCLGIRAFRLRNAVNAALVDSLMVAFANRLLKGPINDVKSAKAAYEGLLKDREFISAATRATADEANVKARMRIALQAFDTVA